EALELRQLYRELRENKKKNQMIISKSTFNKDNLYVNDNVKENEINAMSKDSNNNTEEEYMSQTDENDLEEMIETEKSFAEAVQDVSTEFDEIQFNSLSQKTTDMMEINRNSEKQTTLKSTDQPDKDGFIPKSKNTEPKRLKSPITFKTRDNQRMATRLDYIFIEDQYVQNCTLTYMRFGNSDHLLVESELNFAKISLKAAYWKLNIKSLENAHITSAPSKAPESSINKQSKKITNLECKIACGEVNPNLELMVEQYKRKLQDELTNLANKWQIRSGACWLEEGEKSTKCFFMRYKL
ncbi:17919_t:CDS:2, partial [Dentiscutata erythropus]